MFRTRRRHTWLGSRLRSGACRSRLRCTGSQSGLDGGLSGLQRSNDSLLYLLRGGGSFRFFRASVALGAWAALAKIGGSFDPCSHRNVACCATPTGLVAGTGFPTVDATAAICAADSDRARRHRLVGRTGGTLTLAHRGGGLAWQAEHNATILHCNNVVYAGQW